MKQIRLWYTQPGLGGYIDNYFTPLLEQRYEVILTNDNPDFVISSLSNIGNCGTHFDFPKATKIFFSGENTIPDLNLCDYAIGFHNLTLEDRYFRLPLWMLYWGKIKNISKSCGNKFCNFIYSNNVHSDPIRSKLFDSINSYKTVDSGGGYRNNIGYRVGDKLEFIKDYKFTIAIENSSVSGYTTEKLLEPLMMGSMPIYWGNPRVGDDFNIDRFVLVHSSSNEDIAKAVEEIKILDNDPKAYMEKVNQPIFRRKPEEIEDELKQFLYNIFDQPLSQVKRRAEYGFNRHVTLQKQRMEMVQTSKFTRKVFGLFERILMKRQKSTNK